MDIAIITAKRAVPYVHQTLASVLATAPSWCGHVELYVGTPDTSDVDRYRGAQRVDVRPMPMETWERIASWAGAQRAVANFQRALDVDTGEHVLIFEDDVVCKPGWMDAIRAASPIPTARRTRSGTHDVAFISLYSAQRYEPDGRGLPYATLPKPVYFYGTLGLFVPASFRVELADFVGARLGMGVSFDDLVRAYISETPDTELRVTIPSYVDHIGEVSAIVENQDHGPRRAPMF